MTAWPRREGRAQARNRATQCARRAIDAARGKPYVPHARSALRKVVRGLLGLNAPA